MNQYFNLNKEIPVCIIDDDDDELEEVLRENDLIPPRQISYDSGYDDDEDDDFFEDDDDDYSPPKKSNKELIEEGLKYGKEILEDPNVEIHPKFYDRIKDSYKYRDLKLSKYKEDEKKTILIGLAASDAYYYFKCCGNNGIICNYDIGDIVPVLRSKELKPFRGMDELDLKWSGPDIWEDEDEIDLEILIDNLSLYAPWEPPKPYLW